MNYNDLFFGFFLWFVLNVSKSGTSLVVQRLTVCASSVAGVGLIPGRGTKITHVSRCGGGGERKNKETVFYFYFSASLLKSPSSFCCLVTKLCPTLLWLHRVQLARLLCLWGFQARILDWVAMSSRNFLSFFLSFFFCWPYQIPIKN